MLAFIFLLLKKKKNLSSRPLAEYENTGLRSLFYFFFLYNCNFSKTIVAVELVSFIAVLLAHISLLLLMTVFAKNIKKGEPISRSLPRDTPLLSAIVRVKREVGVWRGHTASWV